MAGEQKAAAVGSLPIPSAFQGIPMYTHQEKVASAVTDHWSEPSDQFCGKTASGKFQQLHVVVDGDQYVAKLSEPE